MPGSVIQLPAPLRAGDPFSGYQFVIEPGETGWYHTDGLPYWISSFCVGIMKAMLAQYPGGPILRDLKYHFANEWQSYTTRELERLRGKEVYRWDSSEMAQILKELHVQSFESATLKIDIHIEETNNPNQHGVVSVIRGDFNNFGRAGDPVYTDNGMPDSGAFRSYDISMGVTDKFLQILYTESPEQIDGYSQGYSSAATHEFGHTLGLGHTFNRLKLPGFEDNLQFTRMSYTALPGKIYEDGRFVDFTEMDTAALQYLYGPSKQVRTGDDTHVLDANKPNWLWDGLGADTVDASALTAGVTLSLQPGYWGYIGAARGYGITAPGSVTVNYGSTFENITGSAFNDTFTGNEVNNRIDGGAGTDTVVFTHARNSYTLTPNANGQWIVKDHHAAPATPQPLMSIDISQYTFDAYPLSSGLAAVPFDGNDGTDTLIGVERLRFTDQSLALDLADGQAANTVARLIGTAFGKPQLENKALVGVGLALVDGGLDRLGLSQLLVDNRLLGSVAGGNDNTQVLKWVFQNVVGRAATAQELAQLMPLVDEHGQAWLIGAASALPQTATQVDLVGLSATGLAFV